MASTNVKYTVLTNYVNAPTERNFNKIATVFIDDINMIVYSNTYGYEYNIFGEDITSKTLLVLWNKLKDFKLDSDPQIAVSSFTKYLKNIVKNILKREKSEHFKIWMQSKRTTFRTKTAVSGESNSEISLMR